MRTFNSLKEYIDNSELTPEITEKVLLECSKYNDELSDFLSYHKWNELPGNALKKFVYAYQESKTNIKTGEILEPSDSIYPIIILPPLEDLSVGIEFIPSEQAENSYCELIIEARDENDKVITQTFFGVNTLEGIEFEFFNKDDNYFFDEQVFFKLSRLDSRIKKINILVTPTENTATTKEPFNFVSVCLMEEDTVVDEYKITEDINKNKEPIVYQFIWDINEWRLNFGPVK